MNIYNIAFSFPPVLLFAFYYIVLLIKIQCGNRLRFHEEKAERLFPSLLLIIYICFPTAPPSAAILLALATVSSAASEATTVSFVSELLLTAGEVSADCLLLHPVTAKATAIAIVSITVLFLLFISIFLSCSLECLLFLSQSDYMLRL